MKFVRLFTKYVDDNDGLSSRKNSVRLCTTTRLTVACLRIVFTTIRDFYNRSIYLAREFSIVIFGNHFKQNVTVFLYCVL